MRDVKPSPEEFTYGRDQLGDGNYSHVSQCNHGYTGELFAIKTILLDKVKRVAYRHKDVHNEIFQEKEVLLKLNHPFIVKLYYTMKDKMTLYYLMECPLGGELWDKIKDKKSDELVGLFESQTKYYSSQIVLALEYLHSQHIVHRDLKPENILLTRSGLIKIIDFGTSKNMSDDKYNGQEFRGTPEYMSPESINNKYCGPPVDLWSFGSIIYQLLCGYPPFKTGSPYITFQRIQKVQYYLPDTLSDNARDLIKKLLVLEPKERIGYGKSIEYIYIYII